MNAEAPWPLIEVTIEPKSKADKAKLQAALRKMAAEDPTLRVSTDQESGLTLLGGVDELQLKSKVDTVTRTCKVDVDIGQPQVAYRETLGRPARVRYTHKRATDGGGEFADLSIDFAPAEPGEGYSFDSRIGSALPDEFVSAVENGLDWARQHGLLAGFPVIGFKAILIDAAYHDRDSSAAAFETAARAAFRELREAAAPKLLEPIAKVEVTTPEEFVGDVIGDLNSRKGTIVGSGHRGNGVTISAEVPFSNMLGCANFLASMSRGRASVHMEFDHYAPFRRIFNPGPDDDPDFFPPAAAMRA